MKNSYPLILILLLFTAFSVGAQITQNGQNNPVTISLPASPTAAAFTRHGQHEVSYNTGTPSINIPLEVIEAGTYRLPINLNNHASGIRVTEDASWVGLGWNLNGGGVISRVVRGKPDGMPTFGYFDFRSAHDFPLEQNEVEDYGILNDWAAGKYDGEPDLYSYNFPGQSGQFYIEKDSLDNYNVRLLQESNLEAGVLMEYIGSNYEPYYFHFRTPDGTDFFFSTKETTISTAWNGNSGGEEYTSAFFLNRITSSDNKNIDFLYEDETITHTIQIQETDYVMSSCGEPKSAVTQTSFNTRYTKRLASISGPNKTLIFNEKGTERGDLNGAHALEEILVKRDSETLYTIDIQTSEAGGRLYLDAVSKMPTNGENETYSFDYYTQDLPPTDSKKQDYWGFHNGASNTTLLPQYPGMSLSKPYADREPNATQMLSGSLSRVTYPTGGYTEYVMEPNKHVREETGSYQPVNKALSTTNLDVDDVDVLGTITLNFEQDVEFEIEMDYTPIQGESAVVDIQLVDGSTIIESIAVVDNETWDFSNVPVGTYTLKVWNTGNVDVDDLTLNVNYEEYVAGSTTTGKMVGGLRVKEIINFDGNNEEYIFFRYENSKLLNDLDKDDFFFDIGEVSGPCIGGTPTFCSYIGRTSSLRFSVPSQIISYGKVTEFRTTTEATGPVPINPQVTPLPFYEIGRTEYQYNHPRSIGGGGFPYIPIQDISHSKGQLTSKIVYNQAGQKIKETINEYEDKDQEKRLEGLMVGKAGFILDWWCYSGEGAFNKDIISHTYFTPVIGWNRIVSSVENEYDPANPSISLSTTTNYTYFDDNVSKIYQPIKIETITPTERITKYRYYQHSYSSGLSHISNYPELLIEEVTTKEITQSASAGEVVVGGYSVEYSSDGPWPISYYQLELDEPIPPGNNSLTSTVGHSQNVRGAYSRDTDLILQESYDYGDSSNPSKPTRIEKKGEQYTSYKWNSDGKLKTMLSNSNGDFYFNDFESFQNLGAIGTINPFQGYFSESIQSWSRAMSPGQYFLEFWQKGSYTIVQDDLTILDEDIIFSSGNWNYVRARIEVVSSNGLTTGLVEINGSINGNDLIDCVRVFPTNSQMTNYLYDYRGNLTEIIDPNGRIQFYEYDGLGRLIEVIDAEGNKVLHNEYNH